MVALGQKTTGIYYHDQPTGETAYWYDDGRPWAVNNYYRGKAAGRWIQWDREGNVVLSEKH